MSLITRRFAAVAGTAGLLLPIAACDDRPIGPADGPGLQFSYDGARSGVYRSDAADPTISAEGLPEIGSWAVARTDSLDGLVIAGFSPTDESKGDLFILQLNERREGIFEPCISSGTHGCHGRLFIGVLLDDLVNLQIDDHLEIVDGSVDLAEASDERIRGTFELTLESLDGNRTITATDGVVDLPYSSELFEGGSIACLARNLLAGTNEPCS